MDVYAGMFPFCNRMIHGSKLHADVRKGMT